MCALALSPAFPAPKQCVTAAQSYRQNNLDVAVKKVGHKKVSTLGTDVGELSLIFLKPLIYGLYLRVDALTGIDHG